MNDEHSDAVTAGVLAVLRDLLKELQPGKSEPIEVRSSSDLERDLGLDWTSPEKVEGFSDRMDESEEQTWAGQGRRRGG
jgi:hypothetical protein